MAVSSNLPGVLSHETQTANPGVSITSHDGVANFTMTYSPKAYKQLLAPFFIVLRYCDIAYLGTKLNRFWLTVSLFTWTVAAVTADSMDGHSTLLRYWTMLTLLVCACYMTTLARNINDREANSRSRRIWAAIHLRSTSQQRRSVSFSYFCHR